MDLFILIFYVIVFGIVCLAIYDVAKVKHSRNSRAKDFLDNKEDKSLRYLEDTKRYEFWRDINGK